MKRLRKALRRDLANAGEERAAATALALRWLETTAGGAATWLALAEATLARRR